jgi:hypothetical protein
MRRKLFLLAGLLGLVALSIAFAYAAALRPSHAGGSPSPDTSFYTQHRSAWGFDIAAGSQVDPRGLDIARRTAR